MKPGKGWSSWQEHSNRRERRRWGSCQVLISVGGVVVFCFLLVGCVHNAGQREKPARKIASSGETTNPDKNVAEHYQVGCPDELAIEVNAMPAFTTRKIVGPDGRIELGKYGKPRVEGRTTIQIADLIAANLEVPTESVRVRVSEYRSQQLFLFGQSAGRQQSVPYLGQETVLDFLRRTGALTFEKDTAAVYVVRAHIADGSRPEVFHVDLKAIVAGHDPNTNLRLMPNDQIYVK